MTALLHHLTLNEVPDDKVIVTIECRARDLDIGRVPVDTFYPSPFISPHHLGPMRITATFYPGEGKATVARVYGDPILWEGDNS